MAQLHLKERWELKMHCPFMICPSICHFGEPDPNDWEWHDEKYVCECTHEFFEKNCKEEEEDQEEQ